MLQFIIFNELEVLKWTHFKLHIKYHEGPSIYYFLMLSAVQFKTSGAARTLL